jgi:hypothetical protein
MAKVQKYLLIEAESEFFSVMKLVTETKSPAELKRLKKIHDEGIQNEININSSYKEVTKVSGRHFYRRKVKKDVIKSGPSKKEIAERIKPISIKIREIGNFEKEPTWVYDKLKQNSNWTLKDEYAK